MYTLLLLKNKYNQKGEMNEVWGGRKIFLYFGFSVHCDISKTILPSIIFLNEPYSFACKRKKHRILVAYVPERLHQLHRTSYYNYCLRLEVAVRLHILLFKLR